VKEGRFREDLFYRLNVVTVSLPPLRERREDLPLLASHFVKKSCKANGISERILSQEALRMLMSYSWPGNIRQLENAIEHAVAMSGASAKIAAEMLPGDLEHHAEPALLSQITIPDHGVNFAAIVSQLERELILRSLEKTRGNKRQAARLLQLSRTTLIDKLHRLRLGSPAA
jgi:DNA-binding NtrC family response regulator